jgi:cytochrome c oxidase cbb3-type subunit 3
MSDFFNSGWSIYVAVVTAVSLAFCLGLLIIAARRRVMASDNTTGHVWDEDLRELNNPLPRWWMWLFVITIVFGAIYLTIYPGMGSLPGTLKWSSVSQYEDERAKARAQLGLPADALVVGGLSRLEPRKGFPDPAEFRERAIGALQVAARQLDGQGPLAAHYALARRHL